MSVLHVVSSTLPSSSPSTLSQNNPKFLTSTPRRFPPSATFPPVLTHRPAPPHLHPRSSPNILTFRVRVSLPLWRFDLRLDLATRHRYCFTRSSFELVFTADCSATNPKSFCRSKECRCGEMADTTDLKSVGAKAPCGFESRHRYL